MLVALDAEELTVLLDHHSLRCEEFCDTDDAAWRRHLKRYGQLATMLPDTPLETQVEATWHGR